MMIKILDKQGLTKVINWIKNTFGRIKTIDGILPDENGNFDIEVGVVNLLSDTESERLSNLSVVVYDIANPSEITLGDYVFIADIQGQTDECFVDAYFRDDIGVIGSISQTHKSGGIIEFNLKLETLPRQPKYMYIRSSKYVPGNTNSFNIRSRKAILVKGKKCVGWQPSEADRKARFNQLSSWNVLKDSAQIILQGNGANVNKIFEIADLPYNAFVEKDKFTIGCHIDTKTVDNSVVEGTVKVILNYMTTGGVPKEVSHTFDIKGYSGKLFKVVDTPECAFLTSYTIQTSLNGNFNIYLPFAVIGEYMAGYLPSYSEIINPPAPSVFIMNFKGNTTPMLNISDSSFIPIKSEYTLLKKGVDFEEISDGTNDLKVKYVGKKEVTVEIVLSIELPIYIEEGENIQDGDYPLSDPLITVFKNIEEGRIRRKRNYNCFSNNEIDYYWTVRCQSEDVLSLQIKNFYSTGRAVVKNGELVFKVL